MVLVLDDVWDFYALLSFTLLVSIASVQPSAWSRILSLTFFSILHTGNYDCAVMKLHAADVVLSLLQYRYTSHVWMSYEESDVWWQDAALNYVLTSIYNGLCVLTPADHCQQAPVHCHMLYTLTITSEERITYMYFVKAIENTSYSICWVFLLFL